MPRKTKRLRRAAPAAAFRLVDAHQRASAAYDDVGTVRLYIRLVNAQGRFVKGNVGHSLTLANARVSDVLAFLQSCFRDRAGA